ncbi:MAG TPA: SGNH/GDSL hydrolase family protein [Terriglobales bacterium]
MSFTDYRTKTRKIDSEIGQRANFLLHLPSISIQLTHMTSIARFAILLLSLPFIHPAAAQTQTWLPTWTASPAPADPDPNEPILNLQNQTVRSRVRISAGGSQIRVRLSNEYGTSPIHVGSVTVAQPKDAASIQPASLHQVTFAGKNSITIPAGAPVLSDPVSLDAPYGTEISISLYFPNRVTAPTWHAFSRKTAVISGPGDHTHDEKIESGTETLSTLLVNAVLVPAQPSQHVIVAFGDSLVEGDGSTPDADRNWPNDLIRRVEKSSAASKLAIVNAGIVGNRLLEPGAVPSFGAAGLARFDRDALSVPDVTHIVLLEGMNDIAFPGAKLGDLSLADPANVRSADDVIGAYRQLIARAHARGVKLIASTLTPCEGVIIPGYYSEAKEITRQAVNRWIRTSHEFDGVLDFDAVVRDPDHLSRISPKFASEDHLHPNDAGYQAMTDAIDLSLIE